MNVRALTALACCATFLFANFSTGHAQTVPGRAGGAPATVQGVGPDGKALPGWHFVSAEELKADPKCDTACQAYFKTHPVPDNLRYRREHACAQPTPGQTICGTLDPSTER
jgi:hypothetical protein